MATKFSLFLVIILLAATTINECSCRKKKGPPTKTLEGIVSARMPGMAFDKALENQP